MNVLQLHTYLNIGTCAIVGEANHVTFYILIEMTCVQSVITLVIGIVSCKQHPSDIISVCVHYLSQFLKFLLFSCNRHISKRDTLVETELKEK